MAFAEQKEFNERLPRWARCAGAYGSYYEDSDAANEIVGYLKFEDCIASNAALECGHFDQCAGRLECLRNHRKSVENEARIRDLSREVALAAWDMGFLVNLQCESSLFLTEEYKEIAAEGWRFGVERWRFR